MAIVGIAHVQLAMPAGREAEAREFYSRLLGIPETPKPPELAKRGGAWFESGAVKLHLGVEADFRPARKAHPALLVRPCRALVARLREARVDVVEDPLEGCDRVYVADPFGNRIELMERLHRGPSIATAAADATRQPEDIMPRDNVTVVRDGYEAFRRGDIQAIFGVLDPDVEFSQSDEVPWGGRYRGHDQVRVFFERLTSSIESRVDPDRFVDAGDVVVAVGHTRGVARATGKSFEVPAVHVWTLRDGKVVRFEAYIDHPRMLAALRS